MVIIQIEREIDMKKRALISVYDKTGILDFAKFLISKGIEIISTGGTYKYLKENNILEYQGSSKKGKWIIKK